MKYARSRNKNVCIWIIRTMDRACIEPEVQYALSKQISKCLKFRALKTSHLHERANGLELLSLIRICVVKITHAAISGVIWRTTSRAFAPGSSIQLDLKSPSAVEKRPIANNFESLGHTFRVRRNFTFSTYLLRACRACFTFWIVIRFYAKWFLCYTVRLLKKKTCRSRHITKRSPRSRKKPKWRHRWGDTLLMRPYG